MMNSKSSAEETLAHATRMPEWLGRRAQDLPDHPALIVGSAHWSFAALDAATTGLAAQLAACGVGAGSRVAVLLRNGPHFVVAVHALIRLRAILVPLNVRLAPAERRWLLRDVAARHLLIDRHSAAERSAIAKDVSGLIIIQLDAPLTDMGTADQSGPLYLFADSVHPHDPATVPAALAYRPPGRAVYYVHLGH